MLQTLHIINFAIIEDTIIDLSRGATVFTGETGAGKSILIDALAILTGRRAKTNLIRTGTDFFQVEGIFYGDNEMCELLNEMGFESVNREIILSRRLNRNGRGICKINGNFCTVKQLELIGRKLVRLHEQNDTFELLSSEYCEKIIDQSSEQLREIKKVYNEMFQNWKNTKKILDDFDAKKQEKERRIDILEWELKQIHDADIRDGEDDEIESRLIVLQNHEKIMNAIHEALKSFTEDFGAQDRLAVATKQILSISRYDEKINEIGESVNSALYMIEDVVEKLETYLSDTDFSEEELAQLQSRSETLSDLKRKFGPSLSDVITYKDRAEEEYKNLKDLIDENSHLKQKLQDIHIRLMEKAKELNQLRLQYGQNLINQMVSVLHELGMEHASMALHLVPSESPSSSGKDEMEIYFSANAGEPLRSMREVASGGEVSRIALAVEIVTSHLLKQQTLVFDEIDVGISGKVGVQVARKIKELSESLQILVITHLPQTACVADRHYKIDKIVSNGYTSSKAILLTKKEHIHAIAQMISGTEQSVRAVEAALEMKKVIAG
ncbi:MAG: DNA repair protein RecN [Dialister sp.]|nr:DNA repair protein RecN [Dialister sp.]